MDSAILIDPEDTDESGGKRDRDESLLLDDADEICNLAAPMFNTTQLPDGEDTGFMGNFKDNLSNGSFTIIQGRSKVVFVKDTVSGMYKCHLCIYETSNRSSMRSHYAVHSSARPYACDLCTYDAKRLCDLKKHKVLKHGKTLKSLRKNQWRGKLGNAAYKKSKDEYMAQCNDGSPASRVIEHQSEISMTRSGIPIEIVEEDEEGDDEFPFLDHANCNQAGPMLAENSVQSQNEMDNTPSTGSLYSSDQNSDEGKQETVNPLSAIKTEPDDYLDYFSKHYFSSGISHADGDEVNSASNQDKYDNTNTACHGESGYSSQPGSPGDKNQSNKTSPAKSQGIVPPNKDNSMVQPTQRCNSNSEKQNASPKSWPCIHCNIVYYDSALYFMHMGLHNGQDPWTCNLCGDKYHDVYGFTSHFVNGHANSS